MKHNCTIVVVVLSVSVNTFRWREGGVLFSVTHAGHTHTDVHTMNILLLSVSPQPYKRTHKCISYPVYDILVTTHNACICAADDSRCNSIHIENITIRTSSTIILVYSLINYTFQLSNYVNTDISLFTVKSTVILLGNSNTDK